MEVLIWLGIMILLLIIEAVTVGLTTIWFAAGALAAILASMLGIGITGQIILFSGVSLLLLIFTRPIAVRYITLTIYAPITRMPLVKRLKLPNVSII